jgi:hypothetical protein
MDLLYGLAQTVNDFMQAGPSLFWFFVALVITSPFVILIHELGHTFAAHALLDDHVDVQVGSGFKLLEIEAPRTTINIHALGGGGQALVRAAPPREMLLIAIAGPAASLLALAPTIAFYSLTSPGTVMHGLLWTAVLAGVFGVLQLVPLAISDGYQGRPLRSDGMIVVDALRAMRTNRSLDALMRNR